ncbi:hypothetical protein [Pectobacterium parmentieri]|uniref:hypothetical protein n=1 Tax=Pectobacterium parmentieri TaxID=1905730 RepID=UPI00034DD7B2|nr:hypothetical protein [Pectobacterium parmentieri]MBN3179155.1 hypothetical protein [Pectobacterium parmentieri]QRN30731.1 hypothetical protein IG623_03745 [Pectobacterium parmentieri]
MRDGSLILHHRDAAMPPDISLFPSLSRRIWLCITLAHNLLIKPVAIPQVCLNAE